MTTIQARKTVCFSSTYWFGEQARLSKQSGYALFWSIAEHDFGLLYGQLPREWQEESAVNVFDELANNTGNAAGALSKTFAQHILNGQIDILLECVDLVVYERKNPNQKHIRSGAAKVVQIVALNRPDLAAPYLQKLARGLSVKESQTRSLIMRTMGFCAHLNKPAAEKAISYAEKYIKNKKGSSLAKSADLFLGDFGAVSEKHAQRAFQLLEHSMENLIPNEQDWLLEALLKVFQNLNESERGKCIAFAERWQFSSQKSTQKKVKRILRLRRSGRWE